MKFSIIVVSCLVFVGIFGLVFIVDFDANQIPTGLVDIKSVGKTVFDSFDTNSLNKSYIVWT